MTRILLHPQAVPRVSLPIVVVLLNVLVSGVTAAPFILVANVHSQMLNTGNGTLFLQPQIRLQCPELPGLKCYSHVDGHRIIINVFHSVTEREGNENKDETIQEDMVPEAYWRPDRVSEQSNNISDHFEASIKKPSSKSQEEMEEEYDNSGLDDSKERNRQKGSKKHGMRVVSEYNDRIDNKILEVFDYSTEEENEIISSNMSEPNDEYDSDTIND